MGRIDKKIMAFVGTNDASRLVSALAEYTDDIYAVVTAEYGKAPHPGGNITLITRYLDEQGIESWIERVGVDIVIDGIDVSSPRERECIKGVCGRKHIEYCRIAGKQQLNHHTVVYRDEKQLVRDLEYTVGNVLAEGGSEICRILSSVRDYKEKVMILTPSDPVIMEQVLESGYSHRNIFSCDRLLSADFLIAMFREFNVTDYVFPGSLREGMSERLASVDRSDVKAAVWGDFVQDEGMSADDMWDMFAERFGIE